MRSLTSLPLSLVALTVSFISSVKSTSQPWVPTGINNRMKNMVMDLGQSTTSARGAQCQLQDLSGEPVLAYSKARVNETYMAAAMSFTIQPSVNISSVAFDPAGMFANSSPYLSYLQPSLHSRKGQGTVLSSEVNPLVPYKLPEPSCNQIVVFWMFIFTQPHPLLIENCYTDEFSKMEEEDSKRKDYQFGRFSESAALGKARAATWLIITNNGDSCQSESSDGPSVVSVVPVQSGGTGGAVEGAAVQATTITATITTVISGTTTTTITTTTTVIPAVSSGGVIGGGSVGQSSSTISSSSTSSGGQSGAVASVPTPKPGNGFIGQTGQNSNENENESINSNNKKPQGSLITTTLTSTINMPTIISGSSTTLTTTTTIVSIITPPAINAASAASNKGASPSPSPPSSSIPSASASASASAPPSLVTSIKTFTTTIVSGTSTRTEVVTETETSTVLNLQAPGAEPKPSEATITGDPQSSLSLPIPSLSGFGVGDEAGGAFTGGAGSSSGFSTVTSGGAAAPSAGAAGSSQGSDGAVQSAGVMGADAEPAVVAAVLLGGLASVYFAFL